MLGFLGFLTVVAGSALSSMVTLGTYGALRDKGWSSWKAGAGTGAIGGVVGGLVVWVGASMAPGLLDRMNLLNPEGYSGLAGSVFQSDWAGLTMQPTVAGIVAQQLSGLTVQQVNVPTNIFFSTFFTKLCWYYLV